MQTLRLYICKRKHILGETYAVDIRYFYIFRYFYVLSIFSPKY